MLQYALLHLFGYALSMDDIKAFRVSLVRAQKLLDFSNVKSDH
jgi:transketolase